MTIWESSTLRKRLMLILILKQFNFWNISKLITGMFVLSSYIVYWIHFRLHYISNYYTCSDYNVSDRLQYFILIRFSLPFLMTNERKSENSFFLTFLPMQLLCRFNCRRWLNSSFFFRFFTLNIIFLGSTIFMKIRSRSTHLSLLGLSHFMIRRRWINN